MTTTFDFGYGPVPAHQHTNGGGWVADSATVDNTAYVGANARVFGQAQVYGQAQVFGQARVFDQAQVFGQAWVSGEAQVFGEARVFGQAYLHFGSGVTPSVESGDLWMNKDGTETVRLGCWTGTISDLRALATSDSWPSRSDADYRDRWRPSLLALADLCEAHLAAWNEARKG